MSRSLLPVGVADTVRSFDRSAFPLSSELSSSFPPSTGMGRITESGGGGVGPPFGGFVGVLGLFGLFGLGIVVGGVVASVTMSPVTVNCCGMYCVTSEGEPLVWHEAEMSAGSGGDASGTTNVPDQLPPASTGIDTAMGSVVEESVTKSSDADADAPGAQCEPFARTTVPGGPDDAESVNASSTSAWADPPDPANAASEPSRQSSPSQIERRATRDRGGIPESDDMDEELTSCPCALVSDVRSSSTSGRRPTPAQHAADGRARGSANEQIDQERKHD
ncbi:MAG: hypothetical protein ACT4OX_16900 [Actinomycetota bacterium]